jgi:hypothetical protein
VWWATVQAGGDRFWRATSTDGHRRRAPVSTVGPLFLVLKAAGLTAGALKG